jgi:hypothetical protein
MAAYDIRVAYPNGEYIALIDRFISLAYRREINGTGVGAQPGENRLPFTLRIPRHDFTFPIGRDSIIEVWRNGTLETETVWLVQRVRNMLNAEGQHLVEIGAVPAVTILDWRTVAYASGAAETLVNAPADDAMHDIIAQNFGSSAAPTRQVADYLITEAKQSRAPTVRKGFARWHVLRVLQDLAAISTDLGMPLCFDVVSHGALPLIFRSYPWVRGTDRTALVTLSPRAGTLANVEHTIDHHDEATAIFALGQGSRTERMTAEVVDQARIAQSVFGRRERSVDARHIASRAALAAEARAALIAARPHEGFSADIVNRPGMAYGTHWHWGDLVTAEFDGRLFACRIERLSVAVDEQGRERISAGLRNVDARLASLDVRPDMRTEETETTYHQIHGPALDEDGVVIVPDGGMMQVPMEYQVAGTIVVGAGAKVIQVV